jgi:anti-sigma B factor antagonist
VTGLSISTDVLPAGDGVCSVIRLAGEADITTTTALRDALAAAVAKRPHMILVDMTALTFIDSAATQMIIRAYRLLLPEGRRLVLIHPTPTVARTLELIGVNRLISICDSVDEAVTSAG